jgi:hypothetical protein
VLSFTVNGKLPGDTIEIASPRPLKVVVEAQARELIDRIEVLANGQVVAQKSGTKLEATVEPKSHTWLAARCFLKPGATVRLAHSSPVYLSGAAQQWNAREDEAYFVKWIDDLIAESNADPKRFENEQQKKQVLGAYGVARTHFARKLV